MKEINLTHGYTTLVDDVDFEILNNQRWFVERKPRHMKLYARGHKKINGKDKQVYMHRIIMDIWDPKVEVDHIDANGLNNQRSNLRLSTRQQNSSNQLKQANCSSIYKGVYWNKAQERWQAQIKVNGVGKYLGIYETELEGALAYNEAAKKYFGEFSKLNEISI